MPKDMAVENKDEQHHPVPVYVVQPDATGDYINVGDLFSGVIKRWRVVLFCLAIAPIATAVYLSSVRSTYTAKTYLLPPQEQMIQGLLVARQDNNITVYDRYSVDYVYRAFLKNLRSRGLISEYYRSDMSKLGDANAENDFGKGEKPENSIGEGLKVEADESSSQGITVSFTSKDPVAAVSILNGLVNFADWLTIKQLSDNINASIQSEIGRINVLLGGKLKFAAKRRLDKINRLKEALRIAIALDIQSPGDFPKLADKDVPGVAVNTAALPLYAHGVEALRAEIQVLESRASDESFVSGYRDLQERRAYLEQIKIDPARSTSITRDVIARTPLEADSRRWALLLTVSSIVGLMFGLLMAVILQFAGRLSNQAGCCSK